MVNDGGVNISNVVVLINVVSMDIINVVNDLVNVIYSFYVVCIVINAINADGENCRSNYFGNFILFFVVFY